MIVAVEAAKKTIKDIGGKYRQRYQPLQQSDWTAIISKIRAANPDGIIYSTSGGGPNIDFLKQLKAAGLTMPIGSLSIDELTAEAGGNPAEGVYYAGDYTGIDNPENKRFLEAMKKKFGAELKTPNALSEQEYDGLHAYAMAVEKAGTTNADAVLGLCARRRTDGLTTEAGVEELPSAEPTPARARRCVGGQSTSYAKCRRCASGPVQEAGARPRTTTPRAVVAAGR